MTEPPSVSVCLAAYNGALFIRQQIESILEELGPTDELIVVDDASTDDTLQVLNQLTDPRLRLARHDVNQGYVRTFEHALQLARHPHVFLSDQDDVWPPGRVALMQKGLEQGMVVAGNVGILGGGPQPRSPFGASEWRLTASSSHRRWGMIALLGLSNAPYFGSAMAVRSELLSVALPFPASARELHDGWLALLGLMSGSMVHVEDVVVLRRIHDSNTTGRIRPLPKVVVGRLLFLRMCLEAWRRSRRSLPKLR